MHGAPVFTKIYTYIVHHTRHFTSKEISYSLIVQISLHIHWQDWPFVLKIGWVRRNIVFDKITLLLVLFYFVHAIGIQLLLFLPYSASLCLCLVLFNNSNNLKTQEFSSKIWTSTMNLQPIKRVYPFLPFYYSKSYYSLIYKSFFSFILFLLMLK